MSKIGIFGGTFNPVHLEHVNIVKNAIKELGLTKVMVVPTYMPPHKNTLPAPAGDRVNMLKIAFSEVKNAEISLYEVDKQGKSYSYQTVEHFKKLYPDSELYFICGGDMLTDFKTWKNPSQILKNARLAVFGRENFFTDYQAETRYFKENFNDSFVKLNYVGKDFSSTKIRTYLSLRVSTKGLIDDNVYDYIVKNGLYLGDKYSKYILENLPEKRRIHTANVVCTALSKVKELNLDYQKVYLASLLHDVAKYLNPKDYPNANIPCDVPAPVLHAFLGAYVVEHVLGIDDIEVIDAVRYHTSGKPNMSTLAKLIFTADMVEEGRDYEGVEILRELYKKDLEIAFRECLKEEILHLINKKSLIYHQTLDAYDYYCKKEN